MTRRATVIAAMCASAMAVPAVTQAAAPELGERPLDPAQPAAAPRPEAQAQSASAAERLRRPAPGASWINRSQPEQTGSALDVVENGSVAVAPGSVGGVFDGRWFVRGIDAKNGATLWEDRFGPGIFDLAKEADTDGRRAFVAGWVYRPESGFGFVVRAYDMDGGDLLWAHDIGLGPSCSAESPDFARCVAKAVVVDGGRVFVVGHLTRTANASDFAVIAFDAASGAPLWESVTDPTGTGAYDYAWALVTARKRLYVVGETGDMTGLRLQAHDVRTGAIEWHQDLPGALNFTLPETITAAKQYVAITGMDAEGRFFVSAYDGRTGAPSWSDAVDDGQIGVGSSLATDGKTIFASGITGCDPETFLDCELAVRAYDARGGLLWERADSARGGDWNYTMNMAVGAGRLHLGGEELLEDGFYHGTIRSYRAGDGGLLRALAFDEGSGGAVGFINGVAATNRAVISGGNIGSDDAYDFVVRSDAQS